MNKIIKIKESELKQVIENTISKEQNKEQEIENWFVNNIINRIEEKTYWKKPNMIFYVDKNTNRSYMKYDIRSKYLSIDYYHIWSYFEENYSNNYMDIIRLIKYLANKYLGLSNVKPSKSHILIYY